MSTTLLVWILTALAAVVVVLTRLRLGRSNSAGRYSVSRGLVRTHFLVGTLTLALWVAFLLAPADTWLGGSVAGIIALGGWWVTAWCGLSIMMRWRRSRGRRATDAAADAWGSGPALSILAHVGMVAGVAVFTWAYLTSAV